MRCDMVVAVGAATVDGHTLFGHNCALPFPQALTLHQTRGRDYALGESVHTQFLVLPQVRHTYDVVGAQPEGCWGYVHGVNEQGLVVGLAPLPAQFESRSLGLLGTDLVRLTLERCRSAQQGLDLLTSLLPRHGRADVVLPILGNHDPAFLLADPREAFAVESAGGYWVEQEVGKVRAMGEVRVIHQDWDRIAPGFAEWAIEQGRWPADGTKLDFAGCLGETFPGVASGWRRWGRATLLLEQQSAHIDAPYLRRLLSDHYEDTPAEVEPRRATGQVSLCQHRFGRDGAGAAASLVAQLTDPAEHLALAWWAFGPPCSSIWFPIAHEGELPEALTHSEPTSVTGQLNRLHTHWAKALQEPSNLAEEMSDLQARLDQDAEEFVAEGRTLKARGERADVGRLATAFMQHTVERFEATVAHLRHARVSVAIGT